MIFGSTGALSQLQETFKVQTTSRGHCTSLRPAGSNGFWDGVKPLVLLAGSAIAIFKTAPGVEYFYRWNNH